MQVFIFLVGGWGVGWGDVDACKGCMCASAQQLDFNKILVRTGNIRFSYNYASF